MATKKELIYDIKEYAKQYSDDNEYSDRYIGYLWQIKRSFYLRQLLNDRTRKIDNSIRQKVCINMIESTPERCGISLSCKRILKSEKPLPKLLDVRSRDMLLFVGPNSYLESGFKIINTEQTSSILHKPFADGIFAFQDTDGYIYLIAKDDSYKLIETITVMGVFEDPDEVKDFSDEGGCYSNEEYPLQGFLINTIRAEILQDLVNREQLPEDKNNNSNDD